MKKSLWDRHNYHDHKMRETVNPDGSTTVTCQDCGCRFKKTKHKVITLPRTKVTLHKRQLLAQEIKHYQSDQYKHMWENNKLD